jgi:glycosyltransferase involved in cell wall biosynthesis
VTAGSLKVALFTNNYLPFRGGVTTSVETLRRGLEAHGHEAWVFAPRFPGAVDVSRRIVRYPSLPAATYPEFSLAVPWAPGATRQARAAGFDVFHAHHPFLLGPAARRLARTTGRPVVFTYHTRYDKYAHYVPLPRRMVAAAAVALSTRFATGADAVIAPSALIREELLARGVRSPIAVVPTGVDLAHFAPGDTAAARRALGLTAEDRVLLYVGRLDREKSIGRILSAFERVAGTMPRARLVLAGHGTEAEALRRRAHAHPAGDRIMFLGVRPHEALVGVYRAADLFVFASETETQGLVLAEAAACGVPAVSVSGPGCDEVVRDGITGILTKPDVASLAEALIGLLVDGERRAGMAVRARAVAEREFDMRLQIDRTLAVYADALARVRQPAR